MQSDAAPDGAVRRPANWLWELPLHEYPIPWKPPSSTSGHLRVKEVGENLVIWAMALVLPQRQIGDLGELEEGGAGTSNGNCN